MMRIGMMRNGFIAAGAALGLVATCAGAELRPPSVPVVSCDPFFSVWSPSEDPTLADTENWFGAKQPIRVFVEIDGARWRLMGAKANLGQRDRAADVPALKCVGCEVRPLTSIFRYSDGRHDVELSFMTPKIADDLDVFTRPVTYGTVRVTGAKSVRTVVEISPALATNDDKAEMVTNKLSVAGMDAVSIGRKDQKPLSMIGDRVRCNWGWAYLVNPVSEGAESHFLLAYDDIAGLMFLDEALPAWWRRGEMSFEAMLAAAESDYAALVKKANAFDSDMSRRMTEVGGGKYAQLCALAFRQSFAACQVVAAKNGHPLMFSKENTSNGSMGTVDVFYPQIPLLLQESTVLTRASLEPIMVYAASGRWQFEYAPHDVGTYPLGNGQTYNMTDRKTGKLRPDADRMPIEECGNMLIALCALAEAEGSPSLAGEYWSYVTRWVEYLERVGFDPGEQLCTDDFAGHLSHNANLSMKSIMAFAAYARLAELRGLGDVAAKYRALAVDAVPRWIKAADGGAEGGFRLAFDQPGTWSQKYNLVWDRVLGFGIFPKEVAERELAAYRKLARPFGLALDNRSEYTKADWIFWTAALVDSRAELDFHTDLVWRYADETPDRSPFPDWYFANNARVRGFLGRSVIGGVFMPAYAKKSAAKSRQKVRAR